MFKIKNLVLRKLGVISTKKAYPSLSLRSMHAYAGDRSNQWLKSCYVKKTEILHLLDFMDVAKVHFSGELFITSYNDGKILCDHTNTPSEGLNPVNCNSETLSSAVSLMASLALNTVFLYLHGIATSVTFVTPAAFRVSQSWLCASIKQKLCVSRCLTAT